MTEWLNDKAVCRSAPATPGLIITLIGRQTKKGLKEHWAEFEDKHILASKFIKCTLWVDVSNTQHPGCTWMVCGDLYGRVSALNGAWKGPEHNGLYSWIWKDEWFQLQPSPKAEFQKKKDKQIFLVLP